MTFGATSESPKATCLGSIGCAEASTGQNNSEMKFGATSESPKATCLGSIDCAETSTSQINSEMKFGGTSKHPLSPTRETNSSKTRKTSVINNNKTVENANDKNEVLTASGLDVAASGHDEFEQRAQQGSGTNTRKLSVEDIRHKLFKAQQNCYQIQTSLFKTLVSKLRNFEDYLKLEAQKDTASEEVVLDKLQSLVLLLESLQMCLDIQSGLNHGLRTVLEETSKSAAEHEVCYDSCDEDISLSKDDLASIMEDKDDLLVESRSLMNHTAFAKSLVCVHLVNPYSSDIRYACGDDRVFGSCDLVPNIYYLPDGQGRLESLSRNLIYEGRWKKGKRWGYGKAFIFCGSELSASKKQYGMYQGCWWNNMRHGHGRIVFASSTEYKGEWQFDLMSGVGTMIYPDGSSLEGIWDENEPDGCGMYTWPNGKVEYREYKKGQVLRVIQLPENTRQMSTYHGNVVRDYTILRLKYQTLREEKAGLLQSNSRLTVALEVQTMDSITSKRKLECLHEEKVKTLRTEFRKLLYSKKVEIKEKHGIQVKKMKESHDSKTKELEDKISEVKKELDERKTALLCQICYDCDRDCIIMPCTHMLYCRDCISKEKKEGRNRCPACRGAISGEIYCNINL
ncbi:hypothetical protein QZH41_015834 [Actinostola sp. cb2023]|nr:hypothetical protein QZH41_015834 [Actinostola sp. cb2023]